MKQFKDYHEADHNRLMKPRLSIGASYAFVDNAKRNRVIIGSVPEDGGTTDYHNAEADFMFKYAGWSVFGEAFWRQGTRDSGPLEDENGDPILGDDDEPIETELARNGLGFMIQTGFLVPKTKLELAGRFGHNQGLGNATSLKQRDEAGGGLSYYFARTPIQDPGGLLPAVERG